MAIKPIKPGQGWAWRFHYGLGTIQRAYKASRTLPDKEKARIEEKAAEFQKLVDAGEASWIDQDDEGNLGYDYGEHLGELIYDEEIVLNLVRLAFVITLFHFVEQRLVPHLPKKKYTDSEAFKWLKKFGWIPEEKDLTELRLAANCAKHSEGSSADQLFNLRPDMFDASKIKMGFEPGYDSLAITDAHVNAWFHALKKSVPQLGPAF